MTTDAGGTSAHERPVMQHTPGPWKAADSSKLRDEWTCHAESLRSAWQPVVDALGREVAFVVDSSKSCSVRRSFDADLGLIASAPEMLAALRELVALKAIKDSVGHADFEEYKRRQPAAWEEARRVLAMVDGAA